LIQIPIWSYPSIAVTIAETAKRDEIPILIFGGKVLSGSLATCGALSQLKIPFRIFVNSIENNIEKIASILRAAHTVKKLRGTKCGVIGGYTMGMYASITDFINLRSFFGIDCVHIDQLELVDRIKKINDGKAEELINWLKKSGAKINYDHRILTKKSLVLQAKFYLALRYLVEDYNLDFCCIKCQPEVSDHYVPLCLAISLINDPYDHNGIKVPIVCACEADILGAVTMQILKLISGGMPTTLMDIRVYDAEKEVLLAANCGGMSTWFAGRSFVPRNNLEKVVLYPQVIGRAGAAIHYIGKRGIVTIARLCKISEKYRLICGSFEVIEDKEELDKSVRAWPHIMLKMSKNCFNRLLRNICSNHIHAVPGNYINELKEFSEIKKIEFVKID